MDISRRGVLGGLGAVCAVGAVGFAGAATVTDGAAVDGLGDIGGDGPAATGDGTDGETAPQSAAVDPEAPFEARLTGDDGTDATLFGATDLDVVKGVFAKDGEFLVQVVLSEAGVDALRTRLDEAGATDDPAAFVVSMTLDGTEVRRVELDRETVDALTGSEWGGVLTLPFGQESVARSVYERLADD
jgi:hypothetical protein